MLIKQDNRITYTHDGSHYYKFVQRAYQLAGIHIVPGAWYLQMILHVLNEYLDNNQFSSVVVNSFEINKLITLKKSDFFKMTIKANTTGCNQLSVLFYFGKEDESCLNRKFSLYCLSGPSSVMNSMQQNAVNMPAQNSKLVSAVYDNMVNYGVSFSGQFRPIATFSSHGPLMIAKIAKKRSDNSAKQVTGHWHAIFQALTFFIASRQLNSPHEDIWSLPAGFSEIQIFKSFSDMDSIVLSEDPETNQSSITLLDSGQRPVVCVRGCKLKSVTTDELEDTVSIALNNHEIISDHLVIARQLKQNICLYRDDSLDEDGKLALISSVIFLWATKIIPWGKIR